MLLTTFVRTLTKIDLLYPVLHSPSAKCCACFISFSFRLSAHRVISKVFSFYCECLLSFKAQEKEKRMKLSKLLRIAYKYESKAKHSAHLTFAIFCDLKKGIVIDSAIERPTYYKNTNRQAIGNKHAEENLLRKHNFNKNRKLSLFVFRFNKSGILSNAKPCTCCSKIIKKCQNVKNIYYSCSQGVIKNIKKQSIINESQYCSFRKHQKDGTSF